MTAGGLGEGLGEGLLDLREDFLEEGPFGAGEVLAEGLGGDGWMELGGELGVGEFALGEGDGLGLLGGPLRGEGVEEGDVGLEEELGGGGDFGRKVDGEASVGR